MKPPVPTEYQEHVTLADWLRAHKILFLHVPNEGRHKVQYRAKQKRMGVSAGAPDFLIFDTPRFKPNDKGVALEMKRKQGSRTSAAQTAWLWELNARCWHTLVTRGADEAIRELEALGYGFKVRR